MRINTRFGESFVEELAGRTDERFAFQVLLIAWLFTDKDNFCVGRAFAEYGLCGVFPKIARLAILCGCLQFLQRGIRFDRWFGGLCWALRHGQVIPAIFIRVETSNTYRDACIPVGGEVDNAWQDVENWVGEEKAKIDAFALAPRVALLMNYGR